MIRNIIFDIGGVLLDYNPKTYLDKLNIKESKRKELNDIIFHNKKWKDCLNGFITNSELIEYLVKENLKYKNEIEQILNKDNLKYMLPPKQEMIEYYKTLKQKTYKILFFFDLFKFLKISIQSSSLCVRFKSFSTFISNELHIIYLATSSAV